MGRYTRGNGEEIRSFEEEREYSNNNSSFLFQHLNIVSHPLYF